MNSLLVFPLKEELEHFLNYLYKNSIFVEKNEDYYFVSSWKANLVVGGHGKVQFGIQTQFFINQFKNITQVFCLGAAGGLAPEVNIFDIIIGTKTIEHDYKERFDPSAAKPPSFERSILKNMPELDLEFKLHEGAILSGDEDIVTVTRADELYNEFQASAVAWEGAGGARAAAFNNIPFLEIRAITDNARSDVCESFDRNLPISMENLANVIHRFLE